MIPIDFTGLFEREIELIVRGVEVVIMLGVVTGICWVLS